MADIFDYLAWRGDLTFANDPFNTIDNIICSLAAYAPFETAVPGVDGRGTVALAAAVDALLSPAAGRNNPVPAMRHFFKDDLFKLLRALASSRRFGPLELGGFVNHVDTDAEVQFCALTFFPQAGFPAYVAFRGTDHTLVGWKEDFNMIFSDVIPAQAEALAYTREMGARFRWPFNIGGHSKGGNLAVYSAAFCAERLQRRVRAVYNNDGPGFPKKTLATPGYRRVRDRVITLIPQDSVIGLLFEQGDYRVVQSASSGFLQHNPFLWRVMGADALDAGTVSGGSRYVNKTLMDWLASMNRAQRRAFIDALFELLLSTNALTIPDLTADRLRSARLLLSSLGHIDKETRMMLGKTFGSLFDIAKRNLLRDIGTRYLKKPGDKRRVTGARGGGRRRDTV